MSNPIKNDGGRKVPKVANIKVKHDSSGGGNSDNYTVTLELGGEEEKISTFLFSIKLEWANFPSVVIPAIIQPIIIDKDSHQEVEFVGVNGAFPVSPPRPSSESIPVSVTIGHLSIQEDDPTPAPETQSDIEYTYEPPIPQ